MTDERPRSSDDRQGDGIFKRHPKLSILLIAGVFYAILIGMVLVVLILLIRG